MRKGKEWLKEEVNEIKKLISDAWGAAVIAGNRHFEIKNSSEMQIVKRISDLIDQLDEPEVTLDKAFEKVAESYLMTKEEIWRHLERLETHGGKVAYDEPKVLSHEWIESNTSPVDDEGRLYVWKRDLQNLLVPNQEEVDRAYKDGYEKGKEYTFYKGYLEGLADKKSEPETVADVLADFHKSLERFKKVLGTKVDEVTK